MSKRKYTYHAVVKLIEKRYKVPWKDALTLYKDLRTRTDRPLRKADIKKPDFRADLSILYPFPLAVPVAPNWEYIGREKVQPFAYFQARPGSSGITKIFVDSLSQGGMPLGYIRQVTYTKWIEKDVLGSPEITPHIAMQLGFVLASSYHEVKARGSLSSPTKDTIKRILDTLSLDLGAAYGMMREIYGLAPR